MFGGPNCHDGCEYTNQCTQLRNDAVTAVYAAGSGKELNNDITDVFDSKGNLVVHNDYGEDISTVSFDKVVTQTMTSSSKDNVIKFEYHDLDIEKGNGVGNVYIDPSGSGIVASTTPYSVADPRLTQYQLQDGLAIDLCPRVCPNGSPSCTAYDYDPASVGWLDVHPFDMKTATVIHDLHNVTRVQFLDQYSDVIREVVLESSEITDYNYMNPNGPGPGLLTGIRDPSGMRTCIERDGLGRVTQSSQVAAPGFAGTTQTQATTYGYDFAGQLQVVTKDALGTPARTIYNRDALERVQTIDEDVGGGKPALHTVYAYDGEAPPVVRLVALESPTSITYPNGRVDQFSHYDLSGAGFDFTTVDVKAADHGGTPEYRYAQYDALGRLREEGEVGRFAKHYYYDAADDTFRLSGYAHRNDANSPWITTTIASHVVDGDTVIDSMVEPTRTTTFTTVGRYVTQKTLTATVAPPGTTLPAPQTSCESHTPDGRLEASIQPEGNGIIYAYPAPDSTGHTVRMQRGFGVPTTDAWAQGCAGKTAPAGDPMLSAPYGTHYAANGFIDTVVDEELRTRKNTTDGFGRVIQIEAVQNPNHADAIPVQRFGYDGKGNRIWEATYKPGTTLASDPYKTPDPKDPALLSYSASEYDLQGRVTKHHKYVLETGDDLVQTWDRNDQAGLTVTTDRTSSETLKYDYRGRLLEEVRPDQSTKSIVHGLGVDTVTTQVNQGSPITRVNNYDTRGRLLNTQDNRGAASPLYVATYDDDNNKLTEQSRGLGQVTRKYDSFGRLVEEDHVRNGVTVPTTYEYDGNNRMTATVDGESHRWQMTFTGTDAPLTVTDPLKRVGTYTYIAGWPMSLAATKRDPNGRVTSFTYDSEARAMDLYNGDCGSTRDPWSCSVSTLVSQSHTIYDERGLVKEVDGGPANPTPVVYTHDSLGRVLTESVGTETVISHPFTDLGFTQTTQITHGAWAATMKHKYDTSNRLHTVEVAGQAQPVVATYDFGQGAGGPLSLSYANGATTKYTYDDMLRQTGMDVSFSPPGSTTALPVTSLHQAYGPDSIPRLRQFQFGTDAALTNVFEVDSDGRLAAENLNLTGITLPAGEIDNSGVDPYIQQRGPTWRQYTLDNADNIKQRTTIQSSKLLNTIFAMDALSRVTSVGNKVVSHDARDNIDVKGTQDPVTFAFDAFTGTVTSAKSATGTTTFHYDALGRRLTATPPKSADVVYIWDGSALVGHGPENALALDVPGDDVDAHVVSIDKFGAGTSPRFYHQGPDESTVALTDNGGFVEGYSYSAFGEASVWTKIGQQPTDNIFRYQGQVFDAATGTYSMRARQYRPDWGRFVSPDRSRRWRPRARSRSPAAARCTIAIRRACWRRRAVA